MRMKKENHPQKNVQDYYELKTEAVEKLASALKEEEPAEKPTQDPYKVDWFARIPAWVKALFVKYWVAGALCYFGFWGLGLAIGDELDNLVFVGVLTGAVTDLLVNSAFLYFETDKKEFRKFMMIPVSSKKIWPLFVNILYGLLVTFSVFYIYMLINYTVVQARGLPEGSIVLGVEPLLYGLFFLIVDMFFISIKNWVVSVIRKSKKA